MKSNETKKGNLLPIINSSEAFISMPQYGRQIYSTKFFFLLILSNI